MPAGFAECSRIFTLLDLSICSITGKFPMNFSENAKIQFLDVSSNQFTGPLPDIPAQVTSIGLSDGIFFNLRHNRFSGVIPSSWWRANLGSIDLSNCEMVGKLPDVPPSVVKLVLRGNQFRGPVPASWLQISALEHLDMSFNAIVGPPFSWGNCGSDLQRGYDPSTYDYRSSEWPLHPNWSSSLKTLDVSHNPLGIHVGFLVCNVLRYELLEVFRADSCDLHGHIGWYDLLWYKPTAGGSITGGNIFNHLHTL